MPGCSQREVDRSEPPRLAVGWLVARGGVAVTSLGAIMAGVLVTALRLPCCGERIVLHEVRLRPGGWSWHQRSVEGLMAVGCVCCQGTGERGASSCPESLRHPVPHHRGQLPVAVRAPIDFERVYPKHGSGYAEVHHINPLHITQRVENTIADLIVLSANCHRMIHRGGKALTPDELRGILGTS